MSEEIEKTLELIEGLSTTLRDKELCYYDESGTGITTDDLKNLAQFCREQDADIRRQKD